MKTGIANLPLHYGKAPRWLFKRMVKLSGGIAEVLILEYGQDEFLKRISDPFWFQAFGCILGFDWHSSGVSTTTCGALKLAIDPQKLGIKIAGGKGKFSRKTLQEIEDTSETFSLSTKKIEILKYSSRMSAKVDNSCVQDSYDLYHHCFIFTEKGKWVVVQQGLNGKTRYARRYHWISDNVRGFVEEPQSAICCDREEKLVLDMTSRVSEEARKVSVDLIKDNPLHLKKYFQSTGQKMLTDFWRRNVLTMPKHHPVLNIDISKQGWKILQDAYEIQPENYEKLIALKGMGSKKIRALALVSDLIFGIKPSWKDPVKYSYAHGGKDGHPYPVDRRVYDNTIQTLENAIEQARLEKKEKIDAIKRLKDFTNS